MSKAKKSIAPYANLYT